MNLARVCLMLAELNGGWTLDVLAPPGVGPASH